MDYQEALSLAQSETEIVRERKNLLYTFGATRLPYVCLSKRDSDANLVAVRYGEVTAQKPQIAFPGQDATFEGFDIDGGEGVPVLLARRVEMPPARYVNTEGESRVESGGVEAVIERVYNELEENHDIRTAIIRAPDSVWRISILLYIGSQIARSASSNISEHMEHLFRQRGM